MENKPVPKPVPKPAEPEIRYLVRICKTDLAGTKPIAYALTNIKGVGFCFANLACNLAHVEKNKKVGLLTDDEINKLNNVLENPIQYNIPSWLYNHRRSYETNVDQHLLTTDLDLARDNDLKIMKKIKCYRGVRHIQGQPVRGQRTKSHFRKNKGKVSLGVQRKKVAAPADKGEKPAKKEKK